MRHIAAALLLLAGVSCVSPAYAWHPWKTQEIPITRTTQQPPPQVVEIRPTRGTIQESGWQRTKDLSSAAGRSAVVVVAANLLLGVVRVGLVLVGLPIL